MAGDKSLLLTVSIRPAGRKHYCRRNKSHAILMGEGVVVIKKDRSELHYCLSCGRKFLETARKKIDILEIEIDSFGHAGA